MHSRPEGVVSIHAPARGATFNKRLLFVGQPFQFTRPRGARLYRQLRRTHCACFNSRAREGRDRRGVRLGKANGRFNSRAREGRDGIGSPTVFTKGVSIHAPARGATVATLLRGCVLKFQFTRPRGARPRLRISSQQSARFQFTRPRGARHSKRGMYPPMTSFNSRAREGRDNPEQEELF